MMIVGRPPEPSDASPNDQSERSCRGFVSKGQGRGSSKLKKGRRYASLMMGDLVTGRDKYSP